MRSEEEIRERIESNEFRMTAHCISKHDAMCLEWENKLFKFIENKSEEYIRRIYNLIKILPRYKRYVFLMPNKKDSDEVKIKALEWVLGD